MAGARRRSPSAWSTDQGGGRFSFAHALVRDTLYEELSPRAARDAARAHRRWRWRSSTATTPPSGSASWPTTSSRLPRAATSPRRSSTPSAPASRTWSSSPTRTPSDLYERALEVLELQDEPDERRRAAAWLLALGGAEASAARVADAREAFERAAESARALGDADGLVGAAIGIAMLSEAGTIDERLVALIDEALEAIGPERQRRAGLAAQRQVARSSTGWTRRGWSAPLVDGGDRDRPRGRRPADPRRRRCTARSSSRSAPTPRASGSRSPTRWSSWARSCGDARGRGARARLPAAGAARARRDRRRGSRACDLRAARRRAADARVHIWQTHALRGDARGARRRPRGRRAPRRAGRAARASAPSSRSLSSTTACSSIQIRSLQGRAGELLPAVRELAERFPGIPAWRSALISLAARAGEIELGRVELERFAGDDFSVVPRDANWLSGDRAAGRGRRRCSATASAAGCSTTSCCPTRGW